jgi:hypothetical protein
MSSGGTLVERTVEAGLDIPIECVSVAAADVDNDMDVDLYFACRSGAANIANILLLNDGTGYFVQAAGAGGAEGIQGAAVSDGAGTAESVVAADYDVDGAVDLLVTNGLNMQPYHAGGPYQLFRNLKSNTNHWIEIDLQGSVSNRDGIGASVYATAGGVTQLREQNGGYHRWSQHHQRLHFGLAGNSTVDLRVEWPSGIVETYDDVPADRLYRITENGGLAPVDLNPDVDDTTACGKPSYSAATDTGLFVWKDCDAGSWQVRFTAGGVKVSTSGAVVSDQPFASVTPVNLELHWADELDYSSEPSSVGYVLNVNNTGMDGFDFTYPDGATVCFGEGAPAGTRAKLGLTAVDITLPFNLGTLGPCSTSQPTISIDDTTIAEGGGTALFPVRITPASSELVTVDYITVDGSATAGTDYTATSGGLTFQPGETILTIPVPILNDEQAEGSETFGVSLDNPVNVLPGDSSAQATILDDDTTTVCGAPVYDTAVDRQVFLWKDCVAGTWRARFTAGGGSFLRYSGSVTSDQAFEIVTPVSIESGDEFDATTDPGTISFRLGMTGLWEDGFDFSYPASAATCFDIDAPAGISVLVGPERAPVQTPFDPETLASCSPAN